MVKALRYKPAGRGQGMSALNRSAERLCGNTAKAFTNRKKVKVVVPLRVLQGTLVTNQGHKMSDRQNTLLCVFDLRSPRNTAFQIHERIYEKMKLPETDICMIQIGGRRRHVFIKLANTEWMQSVLQDTNDQMEFRHENGEL